MIRVIPDGKRYQSTAKATLGCYEEDHNSTDGPHWSYLYLGHDFFRSDVRQLPNLLFKENFVSSTYDSRVGLTNLQLVRKAHLRQLAGLLISHAKVELNEKISSWQKDEHSYLERVIHAAERVSAGGDIRLLREAIKTNPERKIWCSRRGGGCC